MYLTLLCQPANSLNMFFLQESIIPLIRIIGYKYFICGIAKHLIPLTKYMYVKLNLHSDAVISTVA